MEVVLEVLQGVLQAIALMEIILIGWLVAHCCKYNIRIKDILNSFKSTEYM